MNQTQGLYCTKPFSSLEFHSQGEVYVCCPSWLKKPIGNLNQNSIEEIWNSETAKDIRKSIIDGSYRFCDKSICPYIQGSLLVPFHKLNEDIKNKIEKEELNLEKMPEEIMLNYDRSCNLSCPSCRTELIVHNPGSPAFSENDSYTSKIENYFIKNLGDNHLRLNITGSGDPFASPAYKRILENLDGAKHPNLKIDFQTNGVLFSSAMWEKLVKINKNIHHVYVSIDAATEETYLKVRRGGSWKMLIENLKFLSSKWRAGEIQHFQVNFVVQKSNYKEMPIFTDMMIKIGCTSIAFSQLVDWETWPPHIYKEQVVWDPNHPEYENFLNTLASNILGHSRVFLGNLTPLRMKAVEFDLQKRTSFQKLTIIASNKYQDIKRRRYYLPRKIQNLLKRLGFLK